MIITNTYKITVTHRSVAVKKNDLNTIDDAQVIAYNSKCQQNTAGTGTQQKREEVPQWQKSKA